MKRIPVRDCAFWWLHWLLCEDDLSNSALSKQGLQHWQMQFWLEKQVWSTLGLLNYKSRHFWSSAMLLASLHLKDVFGECCWFEWLKRVATESLFGLNSVWRSRASETAIVANAHQLSHVKPVLKCGAVWWPYWWQLELQTLIDQGESSLLCHPPLSVPLKHM